jgi:Tn3 transposase DDE domain
VAFPAFRYFAEISDFATLRPRYMDAALNHLRATGAEVRKEDLARLSPLSHKHFNMLGRYHFAVPEEVLRGELRPLRR